MTRRIFGAALLYPILLAPHGAAGAEQLARLVGQQVIVRADGAEAFHGQTAAAKLPGGMMLDVLRVNGQWLGVTRGWVRSSQVMDCGEALRFFTAEIEARPNARAYSHRSRLWCHHGDFERALADADQAIRLDAQCAAAWCNRGRGQAGLGRIDEAISSFSRAIEFDHALATAYTHRGRAWTEKGEFEKAHADCRQAVKLDPKSNVAYYYRGRALARERRSNEALADFTHAIQLHPGYVPALNDRGIEYVRRRQYALAIKDFDAAIKADPRFDRVQVHYNRGNAWFALGMHRRALADYRASLRQDADYQPALVAMAACYAHQGNFDDASEWQRKAIEVAGRADRNELLATLDRYSLRLADDWPGDAQSP